MTTAMATVRCGVLGPVVLGSPPARVGNDRQRRLLVSLLLAGPTGISPERLVTQVWAEEEPPGSARSALRTYVHRLRHLLPDGSGRLVTEQGHYVLRRDGLEVDSERFEELLARDAASDDAGERVRLLTEALSLWRGPAYDDLADLVWLTPERVRLAELRLLAQETLLHLRLDVGDAASVAVEATRLAEQHPHREGLRGTQMTALYRCDRQAEALAAYAEHRERLAEDMGLDTSPGLQSLERLILRQDPSLVTAPTARRQVRGYVLGEHLPRGSQGQAVRATQRSTGRDVDLELFRGEVADSEGFIRRFERDARVLARLQHPHIAPILDFWREPGCACLVRARAPGTLADAWRDAAWSAGRLAQAIHDVAGALGSAHRRGVCHGALAADRVLLDGDGHVLVTGFRLAPLEAATDDVVAEDVRAVGRLLAAGLTAVRRDDPRHAALESVADWAQGSGAAEPPASMGLLQEALSVADTVPVGVLANPYRGLEAFDEQDAQVFHGRASIVDALLERIDTHPLCAVVGPSGVGKSSVVFAGLVPAVRATDRCWQVARMQPTAAPLAALRDALRAVWPGGSAPDLDLGHTSIEEAARVIAPGEDERLLLVIDQLEEIWSEDVVPDERNRFLTLLVDALDHPEAGARVVATLRADRYDQPLAHPGLARHLESATVAVGPLAPPDVALAVTSPAAAAGVSVAPDLVARLVADGAGSAGSLPLLQFTLTELFERRSDGELTLAAYEELGGLAGALVERAERAFAEIEAEAAGSTRRLLARLVTVDGDGLAHRARAPQSELLGLPGVTDETLRTLGRARLVVLDRDPVTRAPTVELAHEAMVTAWPRLQAWLTEDRSRLVERHLLVTSTATWLGEGRDEAALLQGPRLERAEQLRAARPDLLGPDETAFVEAGVARRAQQESAAAEAAARDARSSRRLRAALRLVASAAAVILVVSLLAVLQWRRAADGRDAAALSALVARALQEADRRPEVALRMAAAAYRADPGLTGQRALLGTLSGLRTTSQVLDDGAVRDAPLGSVCRASLSPGPVVVALGNPSPGGSELVAHDLASRAVRRFESPLRCSALALGGDRYVGRLDRPGSPRFAVVTGDQVSARLPPTVAATHGTVDDRLLVGLTADGKQEPTLAVVDPASGTLASRSAIPVRSMAISDDGARAVVVADDGARLVDLTTLRAYARLGPEPATYVWAPDGEEVVGFGVDGVARRFGLDGGLLTVRQTRYLPDVGNVVAYAFAPDGGRVAVAGTNGVQVLDHPTLDPVGPRFLPDIEVVDATWLTASTIALVGIDGSVEVVDWVTNRLEHAVGYEGPGDPVGIVGPGVGGARSADGRWTLADLETGALIGAWSGPEPPMVVVDADRALTPLTDGATPVLLDRSGDVTVRGDDPLADRGMALSEPFVDSARGLVRLVVKAAPSDRTHVVIRTLDLATMAVSESDPIEVDPWTVSPAVDRDGFVTRGRATDALQTWDWEGTVTAPPLKLGPADVAADVDARRRRAVVVVEDGSVVVRDLDDASVLHRLPADAQPEPPLVLPGGRVAIRTRSGDVVLWDLEAGVQIGVVANVPVRPVGGAGSYAPVVENDRFWVARGDEFARVEVSPAAWLDLACEVAHEPLTQAEVASYVPEQFDYRPGCPDA